MREASLFRSVETGDVSRSPSMHGARRTLVLLFLLAPAAHAAQGVRGIVVDSTGRSLGEADVILGDQERRTRSDSAGAFQFGGPPAGRLRLRVRLIGYRPHESHVSIPRDGWAEVRIVLRRMPQLLSEVRVTDTRLCTPNSLAGFECRRSSGQGLFRDAGEIRSLNPSAWSDMLDGMPGLRRKAMMTPDGLDWRPEAPPSGCLVEIYNGEDPMFDGHVRKVPVDVLVTRDVVAIEYYRLYAEVPAAFKRYAWPNDSATACGLIVYWLREARRPERRQQRGAPVTIRRP